jgi:LCP family protein required for cell wall assembly
MLPRRVIASLSLLSFLRRFAIACLAVALVATGGVLAGDAFARKSFEDSRKVHVPNLVRAQPGEPANYLLIGSDTRQLGELDSSFGSAADAPGQRSDVMMVLHVDPASRTGRLVSFPRDLVVQIPGHGRDLLNAAYSLGGANGPALVIQTLEDNFPPLKINHYIEVNFKGFQNIVNAIGRIHLYFPTPVHDPYSNLSVDTAGCVSADGAMALAYARSRHYFVPRDLENPAPWHWNYAPDPRLTDENRVGPGWIETGSDLDRIPRQQYFLRTMSQAAIDKTAANPTKLIGLLNAVKNNFTRDTTLTFGELKALIRTFNGLDPRKVRMETLPVAQAPPPFAVNVVATDAAEAVIQSLMQFGDQSPAVPNPPPPNQVRVRVVNGSGDPNAAQLALTSLKAAGFQVSGTAEDGDRTNYQQTQIRYAPGKYAQGYTTLLAVGTLNIIPAISATNTLGADVLVVVGRDYPQLRPVTGPTTTPSQSASSSTAPTSTSSSTTTPTTRSRPTVDTRFVPVDPKTNGPLVGCPS